MKTDIILAGVGGQGILSIATILGAAALEENLYLKQAEVHGMSQRGGDVQSNLRKEGVVVTNTVPFVNIPDYPEEERVMNELHSLPHVVAFDMDAVAKEVASPRSSNMVLLGACAPFVKGLEKEKIEQGIRNVFGRKGEAIVESNIKAFRAGWELATK